MIFRVKPRPRPGDVRVVTRVVTRFAWLPALMSDGETLVWMQRFRERQVWWCSLHADDYDEGWTVHSRWMIEPKEDE